MRGRPPSLPLYAVHAAACHACPARCAFCAVQAARCATTSWTASTGWSTPGRAAATASWRVRLHLFWAPGHSSQLAALQWAACAVLAARKHGRSSRLGGAQSGPCCRPLLDHAVPHPLSTLADEMGLGKTVQCASMIGEAAAARPAVACSAPMHAACAFAGIVAWRPACRRQRPRPHPQVHVRTPTSRRRRAAAWPPQATCRRSSRLRGPSWWWCRCPPCPTGSSGCCRAAATLPCPAFARCLRHQCQFASLAGGPGGLGPWRRRSRPGLPAFPPTCACRLLPLRVFLAGSSGSGSPRSTPLCTWGTHSPERCGPQLARGPAYIRGSGQASGRAACRLPWAPAFLPLPPRRGACGRTLCELHAHCLQWLWRSGCLQMLPPWQRWPAGMWEREV